MSFLPQDYEAPGQTNFFMKLQDGENKIRILSQPILGWEDWENKKPFRFKYYEKPERSIDARKPIKHFWSFIVWNYNEGQIQILHVTQASIRKALQALCNDKDWGAPYFYDIKITKSGKDMETKYNMVPLSHKPVSNEIIEAFNDRKCCLDAMFDNMDPFDNIYARYTPGIFKESDLNISEKIEKLDSLELNKPKIDIQRAALLAETIEMCSPEYQQSISNFLIKNNFKSYEDMPLETFNVLLERATKEKKTFIDQLKKNLETQFKSKGSDVPF